MGGKGKGKAGATATAEVDVTDLEAAINADLGAGSDPADGDDTAADNAKGETPAPKPAPKGKKAAKAEPEVPDLKGKMVKFAGSEEDGEGEMFGKVVSQEGTALKIETDTAMYDGEVEDVVVIEDEDEPSPETDDSTNTAEASEVEPGEETLGGDEAAETATEEDDVGTATATKKGTTKGTTAKAGGKKGTNGTEAPSATPTEKRDERIPDIRILTIADIKIPKDRPRGAPDPEEEDFKRLVSDIKSRKLRYPIIVTDFDKPVLIEGLRRITAYTILGLTEIPAMLPPNAGAIEDADDRLWNAALDNEHRKGMHFTDLARTFAALVGGVKEKGKPKYTQRAVAKAWGLQDSEVSRMIATLKLPAAVIEASKGPDAPPESVFMELAGADPKVVKEIAAALADPKTSATVTVKDVRNLKSNAKKDAAAAAATESGKPAPKTTPKPSTKPAPKGLTYKTLAATETGQAMRVTVHGDHAEFRFSVPWKNKTYKGFDLFKALKEIVSENFKSADTTIDSFDALIKAMTDARGEIV